MAEMMVSQQNVPPVMYLPKLRAREQKESVNGSAIMHEEKKVRSMLSASL